MAYGTPPDSADEASALRRTRIDHLADQCVKCGLCLPHCPTYSLDPIEAESPRGRIALAQAVATGELQADQNLRTHLDHCLACLSCERVCPPGVRYGELLVETRALLGPSPQRPRWLLEMLANPRMLKRVLPLARLVQAWRWLPALARRLPENSPWAAMLTALPQPPSSPSLPPLTPALGSTRGRVALFQGCVASVFEVQAHRAVTRLLAAAGFETVALAPACCGAMARHGGLVVQARELGERAREAFRESGAQTLLTATTGCLATLRAAAPESRVEDACAFVSRHLEGLRFRPLRQRVALHLPCTQYNVAQDEDGLRQALLRIPEIDLCPLPLQPKCCGAAGSYFLEFPHKARRLRDEKLDQLARLDAQMLVTANIGCRLHLEAGLRLRGQALPVLHPLGLLARQLEDS